MTTTLTKSELKPYKLKPWQRLTRLGWGAIFAHVGTLIIVAVYYLLFEVNPHMNNWWHSTVSNGDLRHTIRDVAEGVLGAFLAKAVMWNHFSKKGLRSGRVYDFLKKHTHLPETPVALLASLILFVLFFFAGYQVLEALSVHSTEAAITGGVWSHTQAIWTDGTVNKILGFVCAFIAVRPLHAVFDDIQGYLAGRKAQRPKVKETSHVSRLYPANYRNRVIYLLDNPETRVYGNAVANLVKIGIPVGFGLAVFGWYVLTYIA